jgi:hypothetical protein
MRNQMHSQLLANQVIEIMDKDGQRTMGIYVGGLPAYASRVGLILNLRTGHVSPQFHVIYNEHLSTVPYFCTGLVPSNWAELVKASKISSITDDQIDTWQSLDLGGTVQEREVSSDQDTAGTNQDGRDHQRSISDRALSTENRNELSSFSRATSSEGGTGNNIMMQSQATSFPSGILEAETPND